ncbi:MAG TPA: YbaK/EbsC family protein [Anaeromyxobacteraceae bacterium]|nr:YbaK/EbsC family protein [Anaeromyxobacteraceae bacterium]
MIPAPIESHLRQCHRGYEHHAHRSAATAQELAASEHVSGHRVAKPVVVSLDGWLALAVVSAADRVDLETLRLATGADVALVPEDEFAGRFLPCAPGAEPPLAMFGAPIFVDAKLTGEAKLVMQAGTHEDAVIVDTEEWMDCERAQPIAELGVPVH